MVTSSILDVGLVFKVLPCSWKAAKIRTPCVVLLDVNPNIVNVLLKRDKDMPYSDIKTASKRVVFALLLCLLLLFKKFKLQSCELLLRLDVGLLNEQQALDKIWLALT